MSRRPARSRLARLVLAAGCALATAAGLLVVEAAAPAPAEAAVASDFRAGNIISDAVFYDRAAMSLAEVQAFLDDKVRTCQAGHTCLKDYRQDTWNRPADPQCSAYQGVGQQRASEIIWNVAQACGVNPRVLLVLLQKETSLVTRTNPTYNNAYRKATGYGCPDTAPCDAQYFGFYNQVYLAAWQYRRYANNPRNYSYQAGRTNTLFWHPNASCGTTQVHIENQATAGLYIYTPYPPNRAALDNLYGTGDSCSSYGNRNFWRLFIDWFGSTEHSVVGPVYTAWQRMGGADSPLGPPIGNRYSTAGGGHAQAFLHGRIHWSPATGARAVLWPINWAYDQLQGESGDLGYPVADAVTTPGGGRVQDFQHGRIYYSPATGARAVLWPVSWAYDQLDRESGALGYPVTNRAATPGNGWSQTFQHGTIHYSPATGARSVLWPVSWAYEQVDRESGPLGYPVSNRYTTTGDGWSQDFQSGRIHYSPVTGARAVHWPINWAYDQLDSEAGTLGYPVTNQYATPGNGWSQTFQHGTVHYSPAAGARAVHWPINWAYDQLDRESGALGYPVTNPEATPGNGWSQTFQRGSIHYSPATGARAVVGEIATAYAALSRESGALGYPVTNRAATPGNGWSQTFQHGTIHYSPATGAHAVLWPVSWAYEQADRETGTLGYPITDRYETTGGGWSQDFQNGRIHYSPVTGARAVHWPINWAYDQLDSESGALGYPVTNPEATPGNGWSQTFQRGSIHYLSATGARAVIGDIAATYAALDRESGVLGYPVTHRAAGPDDGWSQAFQHGTIHHSPTTGAQPVLTQISTAYDAHDGAAGDLGYPVHPERTLADGTRVQEFQHGTISYSTSTGAVVTTR